jgi:hypothetical protein
MQQQPLPSPQWHLYYSFSDEHLQKQFDVLEAQKNDKEKQMEELQRHYQNLCMEIDQFILEAAKQEKCLMKAKRHTQIIERMN